MTRCSISMPEVGMLPIVGLVAVPLPRFAFLLEPTVAGQVVGTDDGTFPDQLSTG